LEVLFTGLEQRKRGIVFSNGDSNLGTKEGRLMKSTNVSMNQKIALLTLALAVAAPLLLPNVKAGAAVQRETERELIWDSFMRANNDYDRYRLSDRDVIKVGVTYSFWVDERNKAVSWAVRERSFPGESHDVPLDKVEIVLVSGQGVTWWKGITAFKNAPLRRPGAARENWVRLEHIATQDDEHGPKSMLLTAADLRDGLKLSFEKAKAFGAHTPMYTFNVPNLTRLGGHRITFTWERDG
jgi:hypothetical protein